MCWYVHVKQNGFHFPFRWSSVGHVTFNLLTVDVLLPCAEASCVHSELPPPGCRCSSSQPSCTGRRLCLRVDGRWRWICCDTADDWTWCRVSSSAGAPHWVPPSDTYSRRTERLEQCTCTLHTMTLHLSDTFPTLSLFHFFFCIHVDSHLINIYHIDVSAAPLSCLLLFDPAGSLAGFHRLLFMFLTTCLQQSGTLTLASYSSACPRSLGKPLITRPFPCRTEDATVSHRSSITMSWRDHTRTHIKNHVNITTKAQSGSRHAEWWQNDKPQPSMVL